MRINNNKQNITFEKSILVQGTKDLQAAERLAQPLIERVGGIVGSSFTKGNSVLVVDLATRTGKRAQTAHGKMQTSFKTRRNIRQKISNFHYRLREAVKDSKTIIFPIEI